MDHRREKCVPVSCNRDCGAGCPLLAHVREGKLLRITDNPLRRPHMRGCIRGYRLPETVYSKDRLRVPLLRNGDRGSGSFREISWPEALDRIADRLGRIRDKNGPHSVMAFDGSGACRGAIHHTGLLPRRFFALFGGFTGRTDSYSSAASAFTDRLMLGTRDTGLDAETLERSARIILWGANPCDTRFGCGVESVLRGRKKAGIPIVVIDPRRSKTVRDLATQWIPIYPGTDTAMMAAVLHVLLREDLVDVDFVGRYALGFEELSDYVLGKADGVSRNPSWAERICGVPAEVISDFARAYGTAKPSALLPGLSIQRTLGGEETYRYTIALQAATGNIGKIGGSSGGEIWSKMPVPFFPRMPVPDLSAVPTIPIYRWADAILEGISGGYPTEIHAVYNVGTNYLNQGSDIGKNIRAFRKLDFVVTHDFFLTPTAAFSDIVLPVTIFIEREDVVFPAENCLLYSAKAIQPGPGPRNDYDIFWGLAKRLGFGDAFSGNRTSEQWLDAFMAQSGIEDIERFKSTGIHWGAEEMRIAFQSFISDPVRNPLSTPSGKIEIRCEAFSNLGFSPLPECRTASPDLRHPLRLTTPHARCRINSQNSNLRWARALEPQVLNMNPDDAKPRGIAQGDLVRVVSEQGEMEIGVNLTEDIFPGVLCLLQGAWTHRDENGVEKGGAANILTSTTPTFPSQGSRTHSIFVEVIKSAARK